mgnify:CR=1 FL=1
MVNKLGIHTSHFKAIAPVVSQLMESMPILDNTKSVSVFQINGAKDLAIPINGGFAFGHNFLDAYESAIRIYNDMVEKTRDSYHASVKLAKTQVFEISAVFVCLFVLLLTVIGIS